MTCRHKDRKIRHDNVLTSRHNDLFIDLSNDYVDLSDHYVDLSDRDADLSNVKTEIDASKCHWI